MNEGAFPFTNPDRTRPSEDLVRPQNTNKMKKTFIKSIGAAALLPFAARAKTKTALVDAHTPGN
jgi:hypothetical protein